MMLSERYNGRVSECSFRTFGNNLQNGVEKKMDSSAEGIVSPALSPENDDYANALTDYDELTIEAAKRFEEFGSDDAAFKNIHTNLHKLLVKGDALWDKAVSSTKGTIEHRKTMEALKETIMDIRKIMATQTKALESLYRTVGRSARGLARLTEAVAVVCREVEEVNRSLENRIQEMKSSNPGISPSDNSKGNNDSVGESSSAKRRKETTDSREESRETSAAKPSSSHRHKPQEEEHRHHHKEKTTTSLSREEERQNHHNHQSKDKIARASSPQRSHAKVRL